MIGSDACTQAGITLPASRMLNGFSLLSLIEKLTVADFVVNNAPSSNNPTGLRFDKLMGTFSIITEPATATLGPLVFGGLMMRRRRMA